MAPVTNNSPPRSSAAALSPQSAPAVTTSNPYPPVSVPVSSSLSPSDDSGFRSFINRINRRTSERLRYISGRTPSTTYSTSDIAEIMESVPPPSYARLVESLPGLTSAGIRLLTRNDNSPSENSEEPPEIFSYQSGNTTDWDPLEQNIPEEVENDDSSIPEEVENDDSSSVVSEIMSNEVSEQPEEAEVVVDVEEVSIGAPDAVAVFVDIETRNEVTAADIHSSTNNTQTSGISELNDSLIGLCECPVCLEYMGRPIYQCKRGHAFCVKCKQQLRSCPSCRDRSIDVRNLALEQVSERLHYPCVNKTFGCDFVCMMREKVQHEDNCEFRQYKCPFGGSCSWKGSSPELLRHVENRHSSILLKGSNQMLRFNLHTPVEFNNVWFVHCFGELFFVNVMVNVPHSSLLASVQYLGPREKCERYCFSFSVNNYSTSPVRQITYKRSTFSDLDKIQTFYNIHDCFVMKFRALRHFTPASARLFKLKLTVSENLNVEVSD